MIYSEGQRYSDQFMLLKDNWGTRLGCDLGPFQIILTVYVTDKLFIIKKTLIGD